jgi:hypothetical protein
VSGHQLLLLADRVEESQRVRAEADQREGAEREQAQAGAREHDHALTATGRGENHEGQQQACGQLDADAGDERRRGGPVARSGSRRDCQRRRQQQDDQRVVVRTADREHEQHRVQSDEGRRPALGAAEAPGGPRDQCDRPEARCHSERLERPKGASDAQRRGGVARQCEERAIGGVLEGPADEREDRVGERFGRDVRVRVEAVQGAHAGEGQIAEDILGDQRRPEQQDQMRPHDPRGERSHRQRPRAGQHERVAGAEDQHVRLEAALGQADAEILERAGQPVGPAPAARRHEGRWTSRGSRGHEEDAAEHAQQAESA